MNLKSKNFLFVLILFVFIANSTGCAPLLIGAAAGAGGVVWARGALEQSFQHPLYKVYDTTLDALRGLEMPILSDNKDGFIAKIESEFADGKSVWITIKHVTKDSCEISVRVGAMGDEARSRQILTAISNRL